MYKSLTKYLSFYAQTAAFLDNTTFDNQNKKG